MPYRTKNKLFLENLGKMKNALIIWGYVVGVFFIDNRIVFGTTWFLLVPEDPANPAPEVPGLSHFSTAVTKPK